MLLRPAQDAVAGELVRLLESCAAEARWLPEVQVCLEAPDLTQVPEGSLVVLLHPGPWARWLNLFRTVVVDRRLLLLLWCTVEDDEALRSGAPDFTDWITVRLELTPRLPDFVRDELEARRAGGCVGLLHAPPPPPGWAVLDAGAGYAELRAACAAGPTWVGGVQDALQLLQVLIAHTEAGARHGLVLADPLVVGGPCGWREGAPLPWAQATRALQAQGVHNPGREAALRDLDPLRVSPEAAAPLRVVHNPRWDALLEGLAQQGVGAAALGLAQDLGMSGVVQVWAAELAARLEREELAALKAQGDPVALAVARRRLANLWLVLGRAQEALVLLESQVLPALVGAGPPRERVEALRAQSTALVQLGRVAEALAVLEEQVAPAVAALGDPALEVRSVLDVARLLLRVGCPPERALALAEVRAAEGVEPGVVTELVRVQAQLLQAVGRYAEALAVLERHAQKVGDGIDPTQRLSLRVELAQTLRDLGALAEAEALIQQVVPQLAGLGEDLALSVAYGTLAQILRDRYQLDRALLIRTLILGPLYSRWGTPEHRLTNRAEIVRILTGMGRYPEAMEQLQELTPLAAPLPDRGLSELVLGLRATLLAHLGRPRKARELWEGLIAYAAGRPEQTHFELDLALLDARHGQRAAGLQRLRERVLPAYAAQGNAVGQVRTLSALADLLLPSADPAERAEGQARLHEALAVAEAHHLEALAAGLRGRLAALPAVSARPDPPP